ncbi:MAG: NRDE family protein [Planctomycetota bacterium]
MCTLSVIAVDSGFRVVHNRDELRSRSEGESPVWHELPGGLRAIYPTDPDAGGTWIAARNDGVVYAILNVNPSAPGADRTVSRGRVILDLLSQPADAPLRHPESARMRSYRVVRVRRGSTQILVETHRSFGDASETTASPLARPCAWASSGLGDDRVQPRIPLFSERVGAAASRIAQDDYHRHRWPDRPEISVLMTRDDARTTAITTIEVDSDGVRMGYEPIAVEL